MKMKKNKLFLLISLLAMGLSSCVMYNGQGKPGASKSKETNQSTPIEQTSANEEISSIDMPEPPIHTDPEDLVDGTEVTVYLVYGEYGKHNGEFVTNTIGEPLFLEHVEVLANAKVGDDLPGASEVTSSVPQSVFKAWIAYNNDGKLTEYAKVPAIDGKILYASFSGGNGGTNGNSDVQPTPPPAVTYEPSTVGTLPTEGFGFKFSDSSYMSGSRAEDFDGFQQYVLTKRSFKKDQVFQLCDFGSGGTWADPIDAYSFGGTSAHSENWKSYINYDSGNGTYTVLQDFNAEFVYIKIKYEANQVYFQLGN